MPSGAVLATGAQEAGIPAILRGPAAGGSGPEALFSSLYRELHALARRELKARGLSLGPGTLVHEAYLVVAGRNVRFPDRARFLAYAARTMRGLALDYVRAQRTLKRGGDQGTVDLADLAAPVAEQGGELWSRLARALAELEHTDARLAQLVDLRYFGGLSLTEIAGLRCVSDRTVQRDWKRARLFLHQALTC
jgi:RNA polymerase sigma factor (TIGR02999 family)